MLGYGFHRRVSSATRALECRPTRQERERQLWVDLVSKPASWWDNRVEKQTSQHPDFRHKILKEPLWLDSAYKPSWVDFHFSASDEYQHRCSFGYDDLFASLCKDGLIDKGLYMLSYLDELCDMSADRLYWAILRACLERKSFHHTRQVHVFMVQHGCDTFGSLGEYLVTTLVKCGGLQYAARVFHMLPHPTVISWTIVIAGLVDCNRIEEALILYQHMQQSNVDPNEYTFVALLRACASIFNLAKGKDLHDDIRRLGCETNLFVMSMLVTMYGKCGSLSDAEDSFAGLAVFDIACWTALLSVYVDHGQGKKSMQLYRQMQEEAKDLDDQSFVIAVQACNKLLEERGGDLSDRSMSLEIGRGIHADTKKVGVLSNSFLGSSFVSMYGKHGSISEAEHVFFALLDRSTVSWNALLSAYVEQNLGQKALLLYCQMQKEFAHPDEHSFAILLGACCSILENDVALSLSGKPTEAMYLEVVQALYADAQKEGFGLDIVICSTLVTLYGKCGSIAEAEDVFQGLSESDVTLWNVMLSAYADSGEAGKALELCKQLQTVGVVPNEATLIRIMQACSETGSIEMCKQSHVTLLSSGSDLSPLMANTLVHAYGSCASMVHARKVFDGLLQPDLFSWNALLAGYARVGDCGASMRTLLEMQLANVEPDGYTFLSVLSACGHAGLVAIGATFFNSLCLSREIALENKHYVGIVDLLGRAGDFRRIENMLKRMKSEPDLLTWLCLLRACRTHGNVELGIHALNNAKFLQSKLFPS